MKRRTFISSAALTSFGFLALSRCSLKSNNTDAATAPLKILADPKGYFDLPEGFSYQVISKTGTEMSDGLLVPGRPDGMGAFSLQQGEVILIRNHENSPEPLENSAYGLKNERVDRIDAKKLYDGGQMKKPGLGGTSTIIYDETKGEVKQEFMSLAGTYRNCAGGVTPWNSWLTCEEDVTISDGEWIEQDHGFVFDVPADARGLVDPRPILGMGRFNHEAVAVDPETGIVYMTEDRPDSLIYRFIPKDREDLHAGGQLQVLMVKDRPGLDTRNWEIREVELHESMQATWLNMEDVVSREDTLRFRGFDQGAARFARGEGMWMGDGHFFFACTNGGSQYAGQVFKYDLKDDSLMLFAESEDKTVLHMCDNLTIAPWGEVLVCEDNGEVNRMHFIDGDGNIRLFAINRSSKSELTGSVFSPSGKTLFVNIQENGETLAITGPWEKLYSQKS